MDTIKKNIFILGILFCLILACKGQVKEISNGPITLQGKAQGTYYTIRYFDPHNRNLQKSIDSLLLRFDSCASLWCEGSELVRINRNENIKVSEEFADIFKKSLSICEITNGAFDFTIGILTSVHGFGNAERKSGLTQKQLDSLLKYVGYQKLRIENGYVKKDFPEIRIDFNALAKGYSVDKVAAFLRSNAIDNFIVDIGGEVYAGGKKTNGNWIVGIEKPTQNANDGREVMEQISLENKAIATSGNYRKYFEENGNRHAHTIDPFSGKSVQHSMLSASIVCSETWRADGLATACMVMGLEKSQVLLRGLSDVKAVLIYVDKEGILQVWEN